MKNQRDVGWKIESQNGEPDQSHHHKEKEVKERRVKLSC